jgi:chorismate synthase
MTQQGKTRLDERLIAALLTKPSVSAAAKAADVSTRTAQRRMRDAEFEEKFRNAKVRLVRETTSRLTANAVGAAAVLKKIFDDKKATPGARVAAAIQTIRLTLESYELEELERRVADLEKKKNETL